MKNEYAQWRKLDNAALAFPAVTGKNDTRVFRFYCELKEEIKEENLQEIIKKYPAVSPFIIIQLILQRMFVSSGLLNLILYHSM